MKTMNVALELIIPYWRNPRKNDKTVESLKQSIQRYGYTVPIVLDEKNVIIAGHARYKALKELGHTEVLCVISDMDEKKAKEFRILDNKIPEQTLWDNDAFMQELRDLGSIGEIKGMFGDFDVESFLNQTSGMNLADVNHQDIEDAKINIAQIPQNRLKIPVICPHCHEEFEIDRPS